MHEEETVFIALGSNLGDRSAYLAQGRRALAELIRIEQVSAIYETPPWGPVEQPAYLNQVVRGTCNLPPEALLASLKDIEQHAGRTEGVRYGPRVLDLDILFYGQWIMVTEKLVIPHARIAERAFVLVPLVEIAPDWRHPVLNKSVTELLAALGPQEEITRYDYDESAEMG